jgi:hypothetical protein
MVNHALHNCLGDIARAAAQILESAQRCLLGCWRTGKHDAGDLMHSACIEVLAGFRLFDLPLGGRLDRQLAVKLLAVVAAVAVITCRHINQIVLAEPPTLLPRVSVESLTYIRSCSP